MKFILYTKFGIDTISFKFAFAVESYIICNIIVYKNHHDCPKGRFWPFFLVRYLHLTLGLGENIKIQLILGGFPMIDCIGPSTEFEPCPACRGSSPNNGQGAGLTITQGYFLSM